MNKKYEAAKAEALNLHTEDMRRLELLWLYHGNPMWFKHMPDKWNFLRGLYPLKGETPKDREEKPITKLANFMSKVEKLLYK